VALWTPDRRDVDSHEPVHGEYTRALPSSASGEDTGSGGVMVCWSLPLQLLPLARRHSFSYSMAAWRYWRRPPSPRGAALSAALAALSAILAALTGGHDVGEVDDISGGGDKGSGGGETVPGGVALATARSLLDASVCFCL
jgi:hypothetical protein